MKKYLFAMALVSAGIFQSNTLAQMQPYAVSPRPTNTSGLVPEAGMHFSDHVNTSSACSNCYGKCQLPTCQGEQTCQSDCKSSRCHQCGLKGLWLKDQDYFQYSASPPCPGYSVNHFAEAQKAVGREGQLTLHSFHFQLSPDKEISYLTSSGWRKVQDISRFWYQTTGSILIQPTGDSLLDQKNLVATQMAFANFGITLDADRLSIGGSLEPSLSGVEAQQIYANRSLGSPLNALNGATSPNVQTGNTQTPNR